MHAHYAHAYTEHTQQNTHNRTHVYIHKHTHRHMLACLPVAPPTSPASPMHASLCVQVLLSSWWPRMASLQLLPSSLLALCLSVTALVADCLVSPGDEEDGYNVERVVRCV